MANRVGIGNTQKYTCCCYSLTSRKYLKEYEDFLFYGPCGGVVSSFILH